MSRSKKYNVTLTDDEVKQLKSIIRKKKTNKTIRCRCQILLDILVISYEQLSYSDFISATSEIFSKENNVLVWSLDGKNINNLVIIEWEIYER